jgi:hypothetical protein
MATAEQKIDIERIVKSFIPIYFHRFHRFPQIIYLSSRAEPIRLASLAQAKLRGVEGARGESIR